MDKKFQIITDSCTDLPLDFALKNNLDILSMAYVIEDKEYYNALDHSELNIKEFYDKLRNGVSSKTNQINTSRFIEVFEKYAKLNEPVLAIIFSSALSGTYNSANVAKNMVLEDYPNAKIEIIDSLCASMGEGLYVYYACKKASEGASLEETKAYLEDLKLHIAHWFTVDDIDTLVRGGRVSKTAAFVAKALKIKPVLHVSDEGKLIPMMKKVGRKNSLNTLVDKLVETYNKDNNEIIFISHGDCLDEANYVKERIQEKTGITNFMISEIGPVIGSHSGPGTMAIFFIAENR